MEADYRLDHITSGERIDAEVSIMLDGVLLDLKRRHIVEADAKRGFIIEGLRDDRGNAKRGLDGNWATRKIHGSVTIIVTKELSSPSARAPVGDEDD